MLHHLPLHTIIIMHPQTKKSVSFLCPSRNTDQGVHGACPPNKEEGGGGHTQDTGREERGQQERSEGEKGDMDDICIYIYAWMYVCTHCYNTCVLAVARMMMMMLLLRCHVIRVYCRASLSLSLSFPWAVGRPVLCAVVVSSPLFVFLSLHGAFSLPSKKRYTHSSVACLFFCVVAAPNIITLLSLCYYDCCMPRANQIKKKGYYAAPC